MKTDFLMALLVMIPLIAAVAAFVFPRGSRGVGLSAMGVLVLLAGGLASKVMAGGASVQPVGGWMAPLGIDLRVDGLSALLLLAVAVVGTFVSVYAHDYFGPAVPGEDGHKSRYFWPLWLFLVAALNAMFISGDLFNLYVTLELKGFAAVALVALAGGHAALGAALRYLFVGLSGSLLYLMGVALLYAGYSTVDLALVGERVTDEPFSLVALGLMTVGLMMKAALFPMHFWLPPAHSSAPAPVSAVLSALVVKGSFYILLRLWFDVFGGVVGVNAVQLIGAFGAAAVFWGSVQALRQSRLKLLIAYSTVAQLGYLFLLFPLATKASPGATAWTGGMMLLLSHATAKAAMFLAAGNILRSVGHDRIKDLDGITHWLPVSAFAIGLAGISLIGLPPSGGFVGKWLLLGASFEQGQWWWVVVILAGSLLAAGYVVRVLIHAFTRTREGQTMRLVSYRMEWSAFALALVSLVLGFTGTVPARLLQAGGLNP